MLRFEPTVRIVNFTEQLSRILHLVSAWSFVARIDVVVNSVDDGAHNRGSLHGYSLAIDLDTEGDRAEHLPILHGYLARHLPPGFDVVLEPSHVHVEWDTNRRPKPQLAPGAPATWKSA